MKIRELFDRKIAGKAYIRVAAVAAGFVLCLYGALSQKFCLGQSYKLLTVNGVTVAAVAEETDLDQEILSCRRRLCAEAGMPLCMDIQYSCEEKHDLFTKISTKEELEEKLLETLNSTVIQGGTPAYTVRIGSYSADFKTTDEVEQFLNGAKADYDAENRFETVFTADEDHEENTVQAVLTEKTADEAPQTAAEGSTGTESSQTDTEAAEISAGVVKALEALHADALENPGDNHYETGLLDVDFADLVEVYTTFVPEEELDDIETEVAAVTKEEETNKIYQVEAGDCLSTIAEKYDLRLARLMELNGFTDENQAIYIDQELIVAVPEPDLSILVTEGIVYEEEYSEDPTIIANDSWYTTEETVLQEGVTGQREVNAIVTYENGIETDRRTAHTTVFVQAVPAVIERGTIIPPTYIKPVSGGRFTSGFGRRWGRMHKGVDWAVPTGTTIFASSDGVVEYAGWSSGYGYNVLIDHPDGRKTRYAHMSRTLVTAGTSVSQGQTIGLSGSTGRSTGPHLHFEIIINGSQVNPLDYIN